MMACAFSVAAIAVATSAQAQQRTFDIPAQEAVRSIPQFARQAGIQIVAPADKLRGVRTARIKGAFDTREALTALLAGTGLVVVSDSGGVISLGVRPAAPAGDASAAGDAPASIEEVLVMARRVEERQQSAPISVSSVTSERLAALSITRIQGIDTVVPNLIVNDAPANGMGTIVFIRGIGAVSVSSYSDPPIGIYVDGVVQARPVGNAFDLPDVERVEVLRGPQGTLFGRNTTGGAITIYTRKPSQDFGGSIQAGYGKYNEISTALVLNTGELGDSGWRSKFTFQRRTYDGYVTTPGKKARDANGYYRATSASFALSRDFGGGVSLDNRLFIDHEKTKPTLQVVVANAQALAYFGQSAARGGGPYMVNPNPLDIIYLDPRRTYDPEATAWGDTLTLTWDISDALRLQSITGYRRLAQKQTGQSGGSSVVGPVGNMANIVPVNHVAVADKVKQDQISEELQASGSIGDFAYVSGLYYFHENTDENLRNITPTLLSSGLASLSDANNTYSIPSTSYAAYANLSYKPAIFDQKMELTGGARYTRDEKSEHAVRVTNGVSAGPQIAAEEWSNTGWSASANYQWTRDVMTYVRGSSAYRAGGFNPTQIGAKPYGPETARAVELGFKTEWFERRLRLNGAAFRTYYDDLQINQRNAQTALSSVVNAGKATFTGYELEAEAAPADGLRLFASLGYVNPKYQEFFFKDSAGNLVNQAAVARFPMVSKWTYNIGGQYRTPPLGFGVLTGSVNYAYQSSHFFQPIDALAPNNATNPSGASKSLKATLTLSDLPIGEGPLRNLRLQLYGENLLDNRFRTLFIDYSFQGTAAFNRPRTYGVRLSADF